MSGYGAGLGPRAVGFRSLSLTFERAPGSLPSLMTSAYTTANKLKVVVGLTVLPSPGTCGLTV